jgi:hypothetical protein
LVAVVSTQAAEFLGNVDNQERLLAGQTCAGPACRVVLWAGVRRRSTARYCSAACRQAAYRARRRALDHDAVP